VLVVMLVEYIKLPTYQFSQLSRDLSYYRLRVGYFKF